MFRTGQVSDVTCRSPRSLSIRPLGSRLETREGTETRRKVPASSDGGGRVGGKMNREPRSLQNFNAPDGVEVKKVSTQIMAVRVRPPSPRDVRWVEVPATF